MNLIDLKKDIRYSLGDIKAEKFDNDRLLLAMTKVVRKLNESFHLNKRTKYYKITPNQRVLNRPNDFYFLVKAYYNGQSLVVLYDTDKKVNKNSTSDNSINYIVIDSAGYSNITLQPIVTEPNVTINIYDSLGSTIFDANKVVDSLVKDDGSINVYYDTLDTSPNITLEANYGILKLDYIAIMQLDMTSTEISMPNSFYDVIHFKVVSDMLSDEDRTELQNKSTIFYSKYVEALKDIQADGRYKYAFADLLSDYNTGFIESNNAYKGY